MESIDPMPRAVPPERPRAHAADTITVVMEHIIGIVAAPGGAVIRPSRAAAVISAVCCGAVLAACDGADHPPFRGPTDDHHAALASVPGARSTCSLPRMWGWNQNVPGSRATNS